jgi:ElaA protein
VSIRYEESDVAHIDPVILYRMLWLRVSVFVVEQEAAYPELDGRDIEPGAVMLWAAEDGDVLGTLRVLQEPEGMRIGRVATGPIARGRGVASELMRRAVQRCLEAMPLGPIRLDAQEHLAEWYGRFGFEVSGDRFHEDGIPHVPMTRLPQG